VEPYLGEIKLCAFPIVPRGWALCNGALLPINQNQALFSLLATQYGGNGSTNFALPDLRGRTPVHRNRGNNDYKQGASAGQETVTLTTANLPPHTHSFTVSGQAATEANAGANGDRMLATSNLHSDTDPSVSGAGPNLYASAANLTALQDEACGSTGAGQARNNMQPSLVMNYIICLNGIYPSRS
jgi:microcystin-dependent protein